MPPPNGSAMTWKNSNGGAGAIRWNLTVCAVSFTVIASFTTLYVSAAVAPAMKVPGTKNCEMIQPGGKGEPEFMSRVREMEYFTSNGVTRSPFENFRPCRMWKV